MLYQIAVHFRFLQLFAHNAHNLVKGPNFFEDHEFLGDLYATYETGYDDTVERMIGLGEDPELMTLQQTAAELLKNEPQPDDNSLWFSRILTGERVLQTMVQKCFAEGGYSQGTLNLLAQFADDSEKRVYKLQQRIK